MTAFQDGKGLATAEKHYSHYGARAKELKAEGKKIIGYLSALCPVEIMTAAGVVPIRMVGNVSESITKGDAYMETIVCPFVRNVFDSAIKGRYTFLDGMVLPHQCDSIDRTNDVWRDNLKLPYWHFINFPHVTDDPSIEFTKEILRLFINTLEDFTGKKISDETIVQAIKLHNENRRLMRDLYDFRKSNPPLISGAEMMKVLVAAMSLPVEESSALIKDVIEEIKKRSPVSSGKSARIMLIGDQVDDVAIIEAIEGTGASVVMDELSIGAKMYWEDVDITPDPVQGIAERYLRKLKIPTTFVGEGNTYQENLDARFGQIKQHISEFKVNGAILFIYKYCDPYGFEVPAMKSYIESSGAKVLYLEDEYSTSTLARMKTRIEAFLEMIA
ncbi:MAG: 2-hydroxyacyl-CoA dehydratase [Syntrophorhabdaceae bacterium]|jgi:bzd-type benzoyl-CoA reductase N subunit|nr:2-hydroxyacyl-CoA dehydratase [Syntrophorhabdaceae bacterium]MDI9560501.1 2-hydroxyacyl-CoA dehydratase family protein [Pseudomonadota bacterium]MBV6506152.1 (R)-2-hydroxyisocaproyl-CoA dehydratase beta subunit [Syntrophorhabdaceae bacterium]HNZ58897.1 2-hydroxyacyl-CoA dehydratase family protein [Syntrophorhabdaceae bacterium]HOG40398.1 2-hydroxyacyl-CoA dehydratase family protein [Syntrophorhabdaceae bacterium]